MVTFDIVPTFWLYDHYLDSLSLSTQLSQNSFRKVQETQNGTALPYVGVAPLLNGASEKTKH